MTKHYCDKCGKDISNANRYAVTISDKWDDNPFRRAIQNSGIGVYDVNSMLFCKDCTQKITDFVKGKENEQHE